MQYSTCGCPEGQTLNSLPGVPPWAKEDSARPKRAFCAPGPQDAAHPILCALFCAGSFLLCAGMAASLFPDLQYQSQEIKQVLHLQLLRIHCWCRPLYRMIFFPIMHTVKCLFGYLLSSRRASLSLLTYIMTSLCTRNIPVHLVHHCCL